MRIQITTNELFIELEEKDLLALSRQYTIQDTFQFSILDDEALLLSLRMEGSDKLCLMYEENELIIFLPFSEFENWLNSSAMIYHSEKGQNASNNMHITLKKMVDISHIKTLGTYNAGSASNSIIDTDFNYN